MKYGSTQPAASLTTVSNGAKKAVNRSTEKVNLNRGEGISSKARDESNHQSLSTQQPTVVAQNKDHLTKAKFGKLAELIDENDNPFAKSSLNTLLNV